MFQNEHGVSICIKLRRRITDVLLTSYFPTFLLSLISFGTMAYHPTHFQANVSVNVTTLLVIALLYIGVTNNLPISPNIKLIDSWFIASMVIPFVQVLFQTAIQNKKKDDCKRLQIIVNFFIAICYIIFLFSHFIVAMA